MGIGHWFGGIAAVMVIMLMAGKASAQRPGGQGGRPSFDKLLDAFDRNSDGALEEGEVPAAVWSRLSQADADDDGIVTRKEFDSYHPGGK